MRDEALDDAGHTDQLVTTRDALDRQTSALLAVTAALLRAENSPQTLDRLLQASRKRRTGGTETPMQPTSDTDTPAPVPDLPTPEPEPTA